MNSGKRLLADQQNTITPVLGFRNLDPAEGIIAKCLESLTLDNLGRSTAPGMIALAVTGNSYTDERILQIADALPPGQELWAFSPTSRRIHSDRLRVTHVPAKNDREFLLKIAGHLERFVKSQPVGSVFKPARLPFPESHREYSSITAFTPEIDERHTVRIIDSGVQFDLFCDLRKGSGKLVVFGQDALSRSTARLPHFFRWKWAESIEASVLILNDPTLYLSDTLNAGWWVGTPNRDFVHDAIDIVQSAMSTLGIQSEDVLFFGASAGGFSSLHMASALAGSSALVDIPQTDLRTYSEVREADNAVNAGLGFTSASSVGQDLLYRVDAIERFKHEGNIPTFRYFQNDRDATHVDAQMNHFKNRLHHASNTQQQFTLYSQWHLIKGGHFPLRESIMVPAINEMLMSM